MLGAPSARLTFSFYSTKSPDVAKPTTMFFLRRIEIISHPYSFVPRYIYDVKKPYHKPSGTTLK